MAEQILRNPEVLAKTGLPKTTRDRLEAKGEFPRRRLLSTRSVGWYAHEVDAWIASRREVSRE